MTNARLISSTLTVTFSAHPSITLSTFHTTPPPPPPTHHHPAPTSNPYSPDTSAPEVPFRAVPFRAERRPC